MPLIPLLFSTEIAQLNKLVKFIETVLQLLTTDPASNIESITSFGDLSFSIVSMLLKLH
ncbi:hypothetical protein UF75_3959 [Desulfosporosinus sp. I2]|nr:hypothetical protein UF75_3959 [Desulfosporosinus sp. I2]